MENRLQYLLLILACLLVPISVQAQEAPVAAADNSRSKVRAEFIELGIFAGTINLEDFPSDTIVGVNLTFRATEDFFLQVNYAQASDVELSSAEKSGGIGRFFDGDDRDFKHYDLLVGYNLFQGEFFTNDNRAHLASLYTVAGVGETEFGGEGSFTYTIGVGYQVAFNRRYIVRLDLRDYIFESSLIGDEDKTRNNVQISAGFSYLF